MDFERNSRLYPKWLISVAPWSLDWNDARRKSLTFQVHLEVRVYLHSSNCDFGCESQRSVSEWKTRIRASCASTEIIRTSTAHNYRQSSWCLTEWRIEVLLHRQILSDGAAASQSLRAKTITTQRVSVCLYQELKKKKSLQVSRRKSLKARACMLWSAA